MGFFGFCWVFVYSLIVDLVKLHFCLEMKKQKLRDRQIGSCSLFVIGFLLFLLLCNCQVLSCGICVLIQICFRSRQSICLVPCITLFGNFAGFLFTAFDPSLTAQYYSWMDIVQVMMLLLTFLTHLFVLGAKSIGMICR